MYAKDHATEDKEAMSSNSNDDAVWQQQGEDKQWLCGKAQHEEQHQQRQELEQEQEQEQKHQQEPDDFVWRVMSLYSRSEHTISKIVVFLEGDVFHVRGWVIDSKVSTMWVEKMSSAGNRTQIHSFTWWLL